MIDCSHMQVSSALLHLRQRNTYQGNPVIPWLNHPANATIRGGNQCPSSFDGFSISQESGSSVVEIVKGSRLKAHRMVDAAIQVQRPFIFCLLAVRINMLITNCGFFFLLSPYFNLSGRTSLVFF